MIVALLAGAVLARQTPEDPHMREPAGWKMTNPGWSLRGPRGNEIDLPMWGSSGQIASALSEIEQKRRSGLSQLVICGRPIDIVLTSDGLLVVSFPPMQPDVYPVSRSYDAWSRVKSARDVAETLAIVLTRVKGTMKEAARRKTPFVPPPLPPTNPANPFPGLTARDLAYVNDPKNFSGPPYDGTFGTGIRLQAGVSAPVRWAVSERLADGFLSVAETKDGRLVASYTLAPGGAKVSFIAERATPESALDAIVAAITYRRPPQ